MKPTRNEYPEYYQRYIGLLEGEDLLSILSELNREISDTLNSFPQSKGNYSYAAGKWTVKEVIGHMMDTDRILAYRALAIARGEKQPLPSFDQDEYVNNGNFNERNLLDIIYEYRLVRESNILLYKSFDESVLSRRGIAAGNEISVNSLFWIIAGHQKHHLKILKEKYC